MTYYSKRMSEKRLFIEHPYNPELSTRISVERACQISYRSKRTIQRWISNPETVDKAAY